MKEPDRPDEMPTFLEGPRTPSLPSTQDVRPPFRFRPGPVLRIAVVLVVIAIPLTIVSTLHDVPPPVPVQLNDERVLVAIRTTFGKMIRNHHLHAKDGRLLDVNGAVLKPHAQPGEITLNGETADRSTLLRTGDRIEVVDGEDKTERTVTERRKLPGRQPGNPQFTLRTGQVLQISTVGKISGETVSIRYVPKGTFKAPPAVALTFDDGPWPGSTPRILSILQRMHVKATFFVIGNLVEQHPNMVRRIERAGMAVENHSWDHPNTPPFNKLPPKRLDREMSMTNDALAKVGIRPELFRPPGGNYDDKLVAIARDNDLRVVNWDVDPRDWAPDASAKEVTKAVLRDIRPGSIVDLHDGGGDQSVTVKALPDIIKGIRKLGLDLVTL
jgi:peptidoglycan/xylan/chitin deacetylase (PgdA/CDA1 family)